MEPNLNLRAIRIKNPNKKNLLNAHIESLSYLVSAAKEQNKEIAAKNKHGNVVLYLRDKKKKGPKGFFQYISNKKIRQPRNVDLLAESVGVILSNFEKLHQSASDIDDLEKTYITNICFYINNYEGKYKSIFEDNLNKVAKNLDEKFIHCIVQEKEQTSEFRKIKNKNGKRKNKPKNLEKINLEKRNSIKLIEDVGAPAKNNNHFEKRFKSNSNSIIENSNEGDNAEEYISSIEISSSIKNDVPKDIFDEKLVNIEKNESRVAEEIVRNNSFIYEGDNIDGNYKNKILYQSSDSLLNEPIKNPLISNSSESEFELNLKLDKEVCEAELRDEIGEPLALALDMWSVFANIYRRNYDALLEETVASQDELGKVLDNDLMKEILESVLDDFNVLPNLSILTQGITGAIDESKKINEDEKEHFKGVMVSKVCSVLQDLNPQALERALDGAFVYIYQQLVTALNAFEIPSELSADAANNNADKTEMANDNLKFVIQEISETFFNNEKNFGILPVSTRGNVFQDKFKTYLNFALGTVTKQKRYSGEVVQEGGVEAKTKERYLKFAKNESVIQALNKLIPKKGTFLFRDGKDKLFELGNKFKKGQVEAIQKLAAAKAKNLNYEPRITFDLYCFLKKWDHLAKMKEADESENDCLYHFDQFEWAPEIRDLIESLPRLDTAPPRLVKHHINNQLSI